MPVQMIELEEVIMVEVSDEVLEAEFMLFGPTVSSTNCNNPVGHC